MSDVEFRVRPVAGGWMVESSDALAPQVFRSGGVAERRAERLARAVTLAGKDARVVILDRAQQLVGSKRFWAVEPVAPNRTIRPPQRELELA
jgi:hypothetical protein